jgi:hypothetical protein
MALCLTNEKDEDPDPAQANVTQRRPRLPQGRDRISVRKGLESLSSILMSKTNL